MQRLFDSGPIVTVKFSDFANDRINVRLRDLALAEGNEVELKPGFGDASKIQHDLNELVESIELLDGPLESLREDAQERLGVVVVCCHVSPFCRRASAMLSVTFSYSPNKLNRSRSSVSIAMSGARRNDPAQAS